ncbi:signal peptidase II [Pelagibius sp.]|uniref:signal peptidase II n=1 Tax=Pelagibius sp. TaxID=1931238 RepID=UPI003BAE19D7
MQRILGIATVVLILDQISKWLILAVVMQPPRRIPVTDFFNLVLTYNTGVSFGLFQGDSPLRPYFLSAIALVIVVGLLIWARRQPPGLLTYGVGGVVGGAIGNVIDRMHQPGVVDFLDFHVAGWHWPAFNIADSAIVCGVALILVDGLFEGRRKGYKEPG